MAAHARIGPSSLERVSLCPGSVRETEGLPRVTSEAAAEGTLLHEIVADCVTEGFEPWDYVGRTMTADGFTFELGDEPGQTDPECMVDVLDWIREQSGELFVEQLISLDPWMPGQFGTLDLGIYHPSMLTVLDHKFGYVLVKLQGNKQIRAYAIGFIKLLRERGYKIPKKIRLLIEQPRPAGGSRFYNEWIIPLDELMAFTAELEQIWAAANDPDAPLVAGEKQCYYCEAKKRPGGCDAHTQFLLDLPAFQFDDLDDLDKVPALPAPDGLTPERRAYLVRYKAMFERWLKDLTEQTLDDAMSGMPTPGMKAIDGPEGNRVYIDPDQVDTLLAPILGEKRFNRKLITPPNVDKLLTPSRKNPGDPETLAKVRALTRRPPGKPILVSDEDPRPPARRYEDEFEDL